MTYRAGSPRYLPLDEILEWPRIRVLRILRHFDSLSSAEILEVAREPSDSAYQAFNRALVRLVDDGHVVRHGHGNHFRYSITPAGRVELKRTIAKGEVTETRTH